MTVLVVVLTLAVVLLSVLMVGLLRAHGAMLRHLHELGIGLGESPDPGRPSALLDADRRPSGSHVAHDITGVDPAGDAVGVRVVGVAHDTLLVFLSSGCLTCEPFWAALRASSLGDDVRPVIVTQGPESEVVDLVARRSPAGVTVVMSTSAWLDHEVPGSPFVLHVEGATGRIRGSGTGETWEQVLELLDLASGASAPAPAMASGGRTGHGPRAASDRRREQELDAILRGAGIEPGDPSLYLPPAEQGEARP